MKLAISSLIAGTLFGIGLAISGMMNPAKVLGFLDITGDWDPTLAFVMGGALLVTAPGYALLRRKNATLFGGKLQLPTRKDIDGRLLGGAALFGIGWGLGGFCPGPALSGLATGVGGVYVFVAAMVAGMLLFRLLPER
jgi:uncharacterized protein